MTSQNEEAEELMRKIEKEEEQVSDLENLIHIFIPIYNILSKSKYLPSLGDLQGAKKVLDPQKSDCKQKMEHLIKIHW